MSWLAVLAVAGLGAMGVAAGPGLPDRSGPWQQLGATAVSKQKPIASLRTAADSPQALAFVVTGPAGRTLHVRWSTDCEIFDDDVGEETRQGTISGAGRVVGYPPVLAGATRCYVWVVVRPPSGGRVTATTYAY